MNITKDFLLQVSLVFVPFGIYQAFLLGHIPIQNKNLFPLLLWGSAILLCMSFPVAYGNGLYQDFRIAPLLIGTLYCGRSTGVFLSILVIFYKLYLGGDAALYSTLLAIIFGFTPALYLQKKFERASKDMRIQMAVLLASYYWVVGISFVAVLRGVTTESITVQLFHFACASGLVWLMTVLNENMIEIHTMRNELQNSERLRLIGDLTGVFAHEIRNPMQVARGFLQLLDSPELPDVKKNFIKLSIEELDHANDIIHEFLSLGKPASDENGVLDAGKQLMRSVTLIESYALSKDVFIQTNIQENCLIHGNAQRMNQFLINILKNAIESMPDGGTISASCISENNGQVEIRLKDEGIGMTKQEVEHLGSPYYSLKQSGTGLGMFVCFQIIRSFGGKLHVSSELGVGTEIAAVIPKQKSM